ncbi:MAG TPA: radical SAM family heme chaperone HemW [Candidatus Sulfobium mesophilum]|nr:radical SAM family heme chaperone HemW [Candidatus Sulfobium mesophilum]
MANALYIHIPFCIRKCVYCDFTSIPYNPELVKKYAEALCAELRLNRDFAGELNTIYVGGGTPSVMPEDFFKGLFSCIRDVFAVSSSAEITMEANPGTISKSKIETLFCIGVNRVSIGVQSLNDEELRTLGRMHDATDALHAVELISRAGIRNFSIDLMYGIPGQTPETWRETLKGTLDLGPPHISSYELTPEKNTRLFDLMKSGEIEFPSEDLILAMYDNAIDSFSSAGYKQYEISNFARPGCLCAHNMNYWNRGEYIAVGTGAHSFLGGRRTKNTCDVESYVNLLQRGLSPIAEVTEISPDEELKEFIFLGLRKGEGINLKHDKIAATGIEDAVEDLIKNGHLDISGDRLRLTGKGVLISNSVIVAIFERLHL